MLEPGIRELAQGPNFCVVTSVMPGGDVQALPLWIDCDDEGEHLLVNTEIGRQRYRNYSRDTRCTVLLVAHDSWYRWGEVRGQVVEMIAGDDARAHIDKLAHKYTGKPYANPIQTERVVLKVRPKHQIYRG
jgi:PPOX class probable F420-dependent enzyme